MKNKIDEIKQFLGDTNIEIETPNNGSFTLCTAGEIHEINIEIDTFDGIDYPENISRKVNDPNKKGVYVGKGINLIKTSSAYADATGVLAYLPDFDVFASWDSDHLTLWVFPGLSCTELFNNLDTYLEAQWEEEHSNEIVLIYESYDPWLHWTFVPHGINTKQWLNSGISVKEFQKAQKYYKEGYKCRNGKPEKAIALYEKAITINEKLYDAYKWKASSLKQLGRIDQAIETLESGLHKGAPGEEFNYDLGRLYYAKQDYEKSLEMYEKAKQEGNDKGFEGKINCYIKLRQYHKALEEYDEEMAYEKNDADNKDDYFPLSSLFEQGKIYYDYLNDYDKAIDKFKEALKVQEALNEKSEAKVQKEIRFLEEQLKAGYITQEKFEEYKKVYIRTGAFQKRDNITWNLNFYLGRYYQEQKEDIQKAIHYYKASLDQKESDPIILWRLGYSYLLLKEEDKTLEYFEAAVSAGLKDVNLFANIGHLYAKKGNLNKAVQSFQKALELDKTNAWIYYNTACLYSLQNEPENALNMLDMAIQHGYADVDNIKNNKGFNNVRDTNRFRELVKDLESSS